jgi:hypothetical protein
MSHASRQADAAARTRSERLPRWAAATLTVLLHVVLVLLALLSRPVTVATQQGSTAGSNLDVTYIEPVATPLPSPPPPARPPAPATPPKASPSRLRTTLVTEADDPVPPDAPATPDSPAPSRRDAQVPPADPVEPAPRQAQAPPERPSPSARDPRLRGRPPGMRLEDLAPANAGPARSAAVHRGRGNAAGTDGASLELDGYQVYYELLSETRLRAWRDQGITELFLPLPGTRRLMVCPLEIALRRGSGACRAVEPDDPDLATIGDAREAILMQRVYRMGEVVWNGPGAYR